jgi:hypothetical protein
MKSGGYILKNRKKLNCTVKKMEIELQKVHEEQALGEIVK